MLPFGRVMTSFLWGYLGDTIGNRRALACTRTSQIAQRLLPYHTTPHIPHHTTTPYHTVHSTSALRCTEHWSGTARTELN